MAPESLAGQNLGEGRKTYGIFNSAILRENGIRYKVGKRDSKFTQLWFKGGAVAESSKALLVRENQKIPSLPHTHPGMDNLKKAHFIVTFTK